MPGLGETSPYLHVSTYASWDRRRRAGTGAWSRSSSAPDDEVRRTARGLVTRGMTDADRVRAVYDFVVTSTRYVGLEFGIHGYKPYKVTQVLARRFGDCKDKASLLIALLREVGVDAELVLVRTRRGGRLDTAARVAGDLRSRDRLRAQAGSLPGRHGRVRRAGRAAGAGPGGDGAAGRPARRRADARRRCCRRARAASSAAGASRSSPAGDARVDEQLIIRGQAAPNWREHYQTPGERRERYGRVWSGRFPGARSDAVDMPRIEDRNAPVTVRASVTVPRLGARPPARARCSCR